MNVENGCPIIPPARLCQKLEQLVLGARLARQNQRGSETRSEMLNLALLLAYAAENPAPPPPPAATEPMRDRVRPLILNGTRHRLLVK